MKNETLSKAYEGHLPSLVRDELECHEDIKKGL